MALGCPLGGQMDLSNWAAAARIRQWRNSTGCSRIPYADINCHLAARCCEIEITWIFGGSDCHCMMHTCEPLKPRVETDLRPLLHATLGIPTYIKMWCIFTFEAAESKMLKCVTMLELTLHSANGSNSRPTGQMWPAKSFYVVHESFDGAYLTLNATLLVHISSSCITFAIIWR